METDSVNIPRVTVQGLSPLAMALIAAILVPLLEVLVLDWDLFTIMFIF